MPPKPGHRYAPHYRQATVELLNRQLPGLDADSASRVLQRARAWHSNALYDLHDHLLEHPNALTSGGSACPASLIRVIHGLREDGRDDVVAPACIQCRATALLMPGVRDGGRLCLSCYRHDRKQPCVRCGRITRRSHRRVDGLICRSCRDAEPTSQAPCSDCGYTRPLQRGADGIARCNRCISRPQRECVGCGRTATTARMSDRGPLCSRCNKRPQRTCGGCGQLRVITVRATKQHPELCMSCRPRTMGLCVGCNRTTFVNRQDRGRGDMVCQACRPKKHHTCSRCGNHRPAQAIWPAGPVCVSCYSATKRRPATCGACGNARVLVGAAADGQPVCGACSGSRVDYLCRRCHLGVHPPWSGGLCAKCFLTDAVTAIFGTTLDGPLRPVAKALLDHPEPVSTLHWLNCTATARLLTELAATTEPITHELLDRFGAGNAEHLLRHMLMAANVVPERLEYLDRVVPWLDDQLRHRPAAHARVIRPYVHWTLMRRSRRNATEIGFSEHAGTHLRARILRALELLTWFDDHGVTLRTATQADLDQWLDNTPKYRRYHTRTFLNWALQQGLAHDIAIPARPAAPQRLTPLTELEAYAQLNRCLHDTTLPRDVRLAGALILLFGTTAARLIRLHTDAIVPVSDDQAQLRLGTTPILLPPPLAAIAVAQATDPARPRTPLAQISRKPLLFPSRTPDQPIAARRLRNRLRKHGITPVPGRHAAIVEITGDIPAPILADLLGIAPKTAVRWANAVNTDWTHYLVARKETTDAPPARSTPSNPEHTDPPSDRGKPWNTARLE